MNITMLGSGSYKSSLSFRMVSFARELSKNGWQVTAILPSADKYNDFTADPSASIPGVKLVQPWQPKTKSVAVNLLPYMLTSYWKLLRSKPQIICLYKPTPITVLGLTLKFLKRTPIILDLDDLGSEVMKRQGQSGLQVRLVALSEKLAMRHADAIIVASSYLQNLVTKKYPLKPVLLLPNGVAVSEYKNVKETKLRPAIYYFGAINSLDLIEPLLQAAPGIIAQIPEAHITIIGGGDALGKAKQLAKDLKVSQQVTFTGWSDMFKAQKHTSFGDIAVCYQPDIETVRAASNMKVFQYMAMGSVPVVSQVGDLPLYVQNGKSGVVVQPDNANVLAEALITLLPDLKRRRALARTAQKAAQTDYAWHILSNNLAAFMAGIIKDVRHV